MCVTCFSPIIRFLSSESFFPHPCIMILTSMWGTLLPFQFTCFNIIIDQCLQVTFYHIHGFCYCLLLFNVLDQIIVLDVTWRKNIKTLMLILSRFCWQFRKVEKIKSTTIERYIGYDEKNYSERDIGLVWVAKLFMGNN